MKCTRKTEDKIRKAVKYFLSLILLGFFFFVCYVLPYQMLFAGGGVIVFSVGLVGFCDWLSGGINFCDNEDKKE